MSHTIAQLETDLPGLLHGTNLNHVQNKYGIYARAAEKCLEDISFYETKRVAQITNAVYSDIYEYALPSDLSGDDIIDIRPQVNRKSYQAPLRQDSMEFNRFKKTNKFIISNNSGVRMLNFNSGETGATLLNACDSLTENGTWLLADDALNITLDNLNYVSGTGSLNFDVSGVTTTASLYNLNITETDLSEYEDSGTLFVWVYMPVAITSATLYWGDDLSGKYWYNSATSAQNGVFQVGWNLIRFDWNGATKTGTPNSTKVKAVKISLTYDGNADTDYRIDNIIVTRGTIYEIEYYSSYLFSTAGGVLKNSVSDPTDIVILEDGYQTFLSKVVELMQAQIRAEDSTFDINYYKGEYIVEAKKYKAKFPTEVISKVRNYYR